MGSMGYGCCYFGCVKGGGFDDVSRGIGRVIGVHYVFEALSN